MRHSEVMTKVGEKAQATKSESGRAGHRSKSGATLAVDRGRRVCRSHEGNGVNMTEKGPVRAYGVRAVCTGTSTARQFLDAVFHSLLAVPDADAMNLFDAF